MKNKSKKSVKLPQLEYKTYKRNYKFANVERFV